MRYPRVVPSPEPAPNPTPPSRPAPDAAPALAERAVEALTPLLPPWAARVTRLLDDLVRVPGTRLGVGLDGVLGLLVPGVGDAVTGTGSIALLLLALRERVPTVILGRMLLNIAVDLVVGVIPVVGDVFDVVFRANRQNLALIEQHRRGAGGVPSKTDTLIVAGGIGLSLLILLTPIVLWLVYATVIGVALHRLFGAAG